MRYERSWCGRWKLVEGARVVCTYPRRHTGDCKPVQRIKAAAKRMELGTLLAEHQDSACDACANYVRHIAGGEHPAEVIGLRCDWAGRIHRQVFPGDFPDADR